MNHLRIEMWPVEKLIPYPNAMRKNDHAVRRMISLIQEFGLKLPLLAEPGFFPPERIVVHTVRRIGHHQDGRR